MWSPYLHQDRPIRERGGYFWLCNLASFWLRQYTFSLSTKDWRLCSLSWSWNIEDESPKMSCLSRSEQTSTGAERSGWVPGRVEWTGAGGEDQRKARCLAREVPCPKTSSPQGHLTAMLSHSCVLPNWTATLLSCHTAVLFSQPCCFTVELLALSSSHPKLGIPVGVELRLRTSVDKGNH